MKLKIRRWLVCLICLWGCGSDVVKKSGKADAPQFDDAGAIEDGFAHGKDDDPGDAGMPESGSDADTAAPTPDAVRTGSCGDGVLDPGELCDGDCPADCGSDDDPCRNGVLVGSASGCDARCVYQPASTCADGDGCCPSGCEGLDEDCGCQPNGTCGGNGFECGTFDNGCGQVDCGECAQGSACMDHRCVPDAPSTPFGGKCPSAGCPECFEAEAGNSGGFCSDRCGPGAGCGAGAHCLDMGWCVADCSAHSDCRPEHRCVDVDSDGTKECWETGSGMGRVGDSCSFHSDCGGGLDGYCMVHDRGGFCTETCAFDADCPSGFNCAGQQCMPACDFNFDCDPGLECVDWDFFGGKECLPEGLVGIGDYCFDLEQCPSPMSCVDNHCTELCQPGTCPVGAACEPTTNWCRLECATDGDCTASQDYHCASVGSGGERLCVPR